MFATAYLVAVYSAMRAGRRVATANESTLLTAVIKAGAVVQVDRCPGDSLVAGTPIAHAWPLAGTGPLSDTDRDALQAGISTAVDVGSERTAAQDIAFGLRQLVDVIVKALSPGVNDPTTAVDRLRLHDRMEDVRHALTGRWPPTTIS